MIQHQISCSQYSALGNEQLINLAAVIMDAATNERALASEEFNFTSPIINIKVLNSGKFVFLLEIMFKKAVHRTDVVNKIE